MGVVDSPRGHGWWLQAAAFGALLATAAALLPVSAYLVEAVNDQAENWILPFQLAGMVLVGIAAGVLLHRVTQRHTRAARTVLGWGAAGLVAAATADAVWFVLLAG